jgi:superfamily II DNA/RNA helicase
VHQVDPPESPVAGMDHHVLHIGPDDRFGVLRELVGAQARTLVFTRTKRRARVLTRQLVAAGVPAVELHGNLAQNARTRNLASFADGTTRTLVATDIAARGIHVDGVTLVVHADPPAEHKAYLHRSGRTARAGARGAVVTLSTGDQLSDVRELTRRAGIAPRVTRLASGDPLPAALAAGRRSGRVPAARTVSGTPPLPARETGVVPVTATRGASPAGTGSIPRPRSGAAAFSTGSRIGTRRNR